MTAADAAGRRPTAEEDGLHVLRTGELSTKLRAQLRRLLDEAFDGAFTDEDWDHCLGGWHVVVIEQGEPVSHAAVVLRPLEVGDRRWRAGYVEGVGTAPERQGAGLGSAVMERLGAVLTSVFELGALSTEAHPFYERLGWERWHGPTFVRRGTALDRTPDEDAGIMVLRFGPSRDVALTDPIVCDERAGDDW